MYLAAGSNLTFNALHTGTVTGPREPSITSFGKNLFYFGSVFCEWMGINPDMYPTFATPLAVIILVGFIAALVYNFFRRKLDSFENLAITFRAGLWVVYCAVVYLFALRADQPALISAYVYTGPLGVHQLGHAAA
jgi:hypothetical protein